MPVSGDIQLDFSGLANANPYNDTLITPILQGVQIASGEIKTASGTTGGFISADAPGGTTIVSKVTVGTAPANDPIGPCLLTTANDGYFMRLNFSEARVRTVAAGTVSGTTLGGTLSPGVVTGDVFELEAAYNGDNTQVTITTRKNGTVLESFTDATTTSGLRAGLLSQFLNNNAAGLTDWAANGYGAQVTVDANITPGTAMAFSTTGLGTVTGATISDGTSTVALESVSNTAATPLALGDKNYCLFGSVTLVVTDGVDTAQTSTTLDPPNTHPNLVTLAASADTTTNSVLHNWSPDNGLVDPYEGSQIISPFVVGNDGVFEGVAEGEYTLYGIDKTDGVMQSFPVTVGPSGDVVSGSSKASDKAKGIKIKGTKVTGNKATAIKLSG